MFFTLDEANAAIRDLVAAVNARPLTTNRTLTRCTLFEEQELPPAPRADPGVRLSRTAERVNDYETGTGSI